MQVYHCAVCTGFICDKETSEQWRTAVDTMQISKEENLKTEQFLKGQVRNSGDSVCMKCKLYKESNQIVYTCLAVFSISENYCYVCLWTQAYTPIHLTYTHSFFELPF